MLRNRLSALSLLFLMLFLSGNQILGAAEFKSTILHELERFGSQPNYDSAKLNSILTAAKGQQDFDWQTWHEATKLLEEEEVLTFSNLKSIVENTGRIQSPEGVLTTEKEAMLYTLRALLRRKLRQTRNRLPWTFLLGQTQFFLGERDNFYLKYYVSRGKDPVQLSLARDMLAQIKP